VNSEKYVYSIRADFKAGSEVSDVNSFIPRLWATRKIGYLLNQIRYQGENSEWVDAVIQLSIRYGIITPYTSFLIEEDDLFSGEGWEEEAHELVREYSGPAVGAEAVDKADRNPICALQNPCPRQGFRWINIAARSRNLS